MIKKLFIALLTVFSFSAFACQDALPTDNPNFCQSFKAAAVCYCTASGVPSGMCQDMKSLFNRMKVIFHTLEAACLYQQDRLHYSNMQDCIDDWNCYLFGGIDSRGRACSSTQQACIA